jgi:hypothetical protein
MCFNQASKILPRGIFVMIDAYVPLYLFCAHQHSLRVRNEGAVNKSQTDMVGVNTNLADTRADWPAGTVFVWSANFLVVVGESAAVLDFYGVGGYAGNYVTDLEYDVAQFGFYILEVFFDETFREHGLISFLDLVPRFIQREGGMGEYREALKLSYFLGNSVQRIHRIPIAVGDGNLKDFLQVAGGDFGLGGTQGKI